jgi:uncharacterized protein YgiB involved in biofilm formation
VAGPPVEKLVFVSAKDCVENSKLERTVCEQIIDDAIARHTTGAANYTSMKACEAVEGTDHCERTANKAYRPRLLAFLVTTGTTPVAVPLYAASEPGFHTLENKPMLASDDNLNFSKASAAVAEQ